MSRSSFPPVAPGSPLRLDESLPREMARVACEVVPALARLGQDGQVALDGALGAIRLAGLALCRKESALMRRAHDELVGYSL